jgi:hypothetical protein
MDPLTALSLAGTVVQFVDFGCTILSRGCELYTSPTGNLTVNNEIHLVTNDLQAVIVKLRSSSLTASQSASVAFVDSQEPDSLERICESAAAVAEELLQRLDSLKVSGRKFKRWESFQQAVKSVWSRQEIDALVRRLRGFQQALDTRLLFSIRSDKYSTPNASRG